MNILGQTSVIDKNSVIDFLIAATFILPALLYALPARPIIVTILVTNTIAGISNAPVTTATAAAKPANDITANNSGISPTIVFNSCTFFNDLLAPPPTIKAIFIAIKATDINIIGGAINAPAIAPIVAGIINNDI